MNPRSGAAVAWLTVLSLGVVAPAGFAQTPQALVDRAEAAFEAQRFEETVALFDELVRLVPDAAPGLWQRGIALYQLGRYGECTAQFAAYFAVNERDLENATWHFLCAARAGSPARAREMLLSAGPDPRIMRTQIYGMLRGDMTPEALVALAETSVPVAEFYAYLYAGLYREVAGDAPGALVYLERAASDRYRDEGGFMNVVARVHAARLRSKK
jgi:lipoprotein NlpI